MDAIAAVGIGGSGVDPTAGPVYVDAMEPLLALPDGHLE